jgi:ADP-ribosyl-[dinitrogen reductase] hydrolase
MTTDKLPVRTSITDPLRLDEVTTPGGGLIGMTICPGKHQLNGATAHWERDLALDIARIAEWGAVAVVTLMESQELERFGVPEIGSVTEAQGMEWYHLPIRDVDVPEARFETLWTYAGHRLRAHLLAGRRILLHCRGGLGRTGTIAARLLVELGTGADAAVAFVRDARPGTIETSAQEAHVQAVAAIPEAETVFADRALGCLRGDRGCLRVCCRVRSARRHSAALRSRGYSGAGAG